MRIHRLLFVLPAVAILAVGGSAFASNAYQGSDRSYVFDTNHKAGACDNESDGRAVFVSYTNGRYELERVFDRSGNDGVCYVNTYQVSTGILDHQTCEQINNWPDACGSVSKHY